MAYKPQYCPGQTIVADNRRKQMDPAHKLEKLRDVSDKDIVLIMGHRAPGSAYKSAHPPLAEQQEPACPVRKLVTATDGAKAGDRIRYIQFADSMYNAPCHPTSGLTSRHTASAALIPVPSQAVRLSSAANATSRNIQKTSSTPSSLTRPLPAYVAVPCTDTPFVSMRTG
jgi:hypothetical protein